MAKVLVVDRDPLLREVIERALTGEGHAVQQAEDGEVALTTLQGGWVDLVIAELAMPAANAAEFLARVRGEHAELKCILIAERATPSEVIGALRAHVCELLRKPFSVTQLLSAVSTVLAGCPAASVEVVSARPEWMEIRIPCDLATVSPLEKFLSQLEADLPRQTCEAIESAFREMLNNAIEHGCRLDQAKRVEVKYVRFKRAILCWIKDPGAGFDPSKLDHAAVNNPSDEPYRHILVREERGLRPGGFGVLMANQMVDELLYNERHNEMMFVKYLR